MIDDDERREIAARLAREAQAWRETFPDSECDFSDAAAMMQDLCVFIGLERDALCSEVFKRLADLIEPEQERTCHMTKKGSEFVLAGWWECSECGPVYPPCNDEIAVWALQKCQRCGAEVVE